MSEQLFRKAVTLHQDEPEEKEWASIPPEGGPALPARTSTREEIEQQVYGEVTRPLTRQEREALIDKVRNRAGAPAAPKPAWEKALDEVQNTTNVIPSSVLEHLRTKRGK